MKKLYMFLLIVCAALFAVLPVFAAGTPEEESPEKLVYLTPSWGAPSDEIVAKFQEQTGIMLEVATVDIETSRNRVLTATAGSTNAADVIFISADTFGAFRSAGAVQGLNNLASSEMLSSLAGVDQFRQDGELWAVPLYQQMVMIDYDTAALQQVRMTASDIQTWDDFEEALSRMKQQRVHEYPYAAGIRAWTWYLMALSSGSNLFDQNNDPVFDNPSDPAYQTFEQLIHWFNAGYISPERLTSPNPHPSFWAGQAAFHQAWQGGLGIANDPERSKIAPNADYLLLPNKHYTWLLPAGLTVSAFTDYPQAAMQLIEFFTQEDMQTFLFEANGLFPSNTAVIDTFGKAGSIDGYEVMSEQAQYLTSLPYDKPWYLDFEKEVTESLLQAARGDTSVNNALTDLGEFTRELIAEYE
jgi:multiple sugar transport system substrate-binding protein